MKKIKILSLALASLLILQATNANCMFGNLASLFSAKKPVKSSFKFQKLILPVTGILIVGSIITYFIVKGNKSNDKTYNHRPSNLNNKHEANPDMPTIYNMPKKNLGSKIYTGIKGMFTSDKNTSPEMTIKNGILGPKKK